MLARFEHLVDFNVVPGKQRWPWCAFSPDRSVVAYPVGGGVIGLRGANSVAEELRVELPAAFGAPTIEADAWRSTARQPGLHSLAVHPNGRTVVAFAWHDDQPLACIATVGRAPEVRPLVAALGDLGPMASSFAYEGDAIWLSAESETAAAIVRFAFPGLTVIDRTTFMPAPPPAAHELFVHPTRDDALLLMACGQDGTFVRCARFQSGVVALPNLLQEGTPPTGFAVWTVDGDDVCFVGDNGVELRAWPSLARRLDTQLPEGLVHSWTGVSVGDRLLVAATDEEEETDARALAFDARTLERVDDAPAPKGMWAGRLGRDLLVTIAHTRDAQRSASIHRVKL